MSKFIELTGSGDGVKQLVNTVFIQSVVANRNPGNKTTWIIFPNDDQSILVSESYEEVKSKMGGE